MVCPQCGYDMGSRHKCMRCGYEVKTLAVVDDDGKDNADETESEDTIVIDPSETYITSTDGYYDDGFGMGGGIFDDPFSALFGDVFDPIGDILGGLFGINLRPERQPRRQQQHATEEDMREHKKRKRAAAPVVEVRDVEILDENGNPVTADDKSGKSEKHHHKHKEPPKQPHPHYRRKDKK